MYRVLSSKLVELIGGGDELICSTPARLISNPVQSLCGRTSERGMAPAASAVLASPVTGHSTVTLAGERGQCTLTREHGSSSSRKRDITVTGVRYRTTSMNIRSKSKSTGGAREHRRPWCRTKWPWRWRHCPCFQRPELLGWERGCFGRLMARAQWRFRGRR